MAVRTLLFVGVITVSWTVLQLLSQETHQEHVAPLSNLEIMQQSVQQIMNEMLGALPLVSTGDSILVRVYIRNRAFSSPMLREGVRGCILLERSQTVVAELSSYAPGAGQFSDASRFPS